MPSYGTARVSRAGVLVTVLLHLLVVLPYLFRSEKETKAPPPAGTEITYIKELPGKPKRKDVPQQRVKPDKPVKPVTKPDKPVKERKQEVVRMERLPDTITLPEETALEREPRSAPEPAKPQEIDPAEDMSARIAARQRARGQDTSQQQGEESEADRGNRIARANIASANGKTHGDDQEETTVKIKRHSFSSATLSFNGYNNHFKRRWLTQVPVELGDAVDIETAAIDRLVALIRQGGGSTITWDSERLRKKVKLSARPEDTEELRIFLFKEMFPGYRPASTR